MTTEPLMQTRSVTGSISIQAPPEVVISPLSDARRLPSWGRRGSLAASCRTAASGSRRPADGTRTRVAVRAGRDHGTVDVLVTQAPPRGAYLPVLGTGAGSELVLTVIAPGGGEAGAAARLQQVADAELRDVRDLAEGTNPDPDARAGGMP